MVITYKTALCIWFIIAVLIVLLVGVHGVLFNNKRTDNKQLMRNDIIRVSVVLIIVIIMTMVWIFIIGNPESYRYKDIDFNNDSNTYNLVYEVRTIEGDTKNVELFYLDNQFQLHQKTVALKDSIIGTTVCTVGFDGVYDCYLDVGPIRIEDKVQRDLLVLNKYWAIQLGLMEPTGSDDEKPFDFGSLSGEGSTEDTESISTP